MPEPIQIGDGGCLRPVPPPDGSDASDGPALPPFPLQVFPEVFQDLATAFAAAVDGSVDIAATAMMAAVAAALGPQWIVDARGMAHPPRLWFACVAPSGMAKTPTVKPIFRWLHDEDIRLRDTYLESLTQGAESDTGRGSAANTSAPRRRPRVTLTDFTPEGLGAALAASPEGILVHSDELAQLLMSLDSSSGKPGKGRPFFLSLWSGARHSESRKTAAESDVDEPFAIIYGGTQPSVLAQLGLSNGDGLTGRFLWSIPKSVAGGLGTRLPAELLRTWGQLLSCARKGTWACPQPFDREAEARLDELLREWRQSAIDLEEEGKGLLSSMYGKAGDQLVRITALLHGMDALAAWLTEHSRDQCLRPQRVVPASTVGRAVAVTEYFLEHGAAVVDLVVGQDLATGLPPMDRKLVAALQQIVSPGENQVETPAGWRDLIGRCGVTMSATSLGRAMVRLSAVSPGDLTIEQLPRADLRRWRVTRAPEVMEASEVSEVSAA